MLVHRARPRRPLGERGQHPLRARGGVVARPRRASREAASSSAGVERSFFLGARPNSRRFLDITRRRLHHYLFACALSYAITFFATTLRDRKLISIEQDLAMLATGTAGPFLTMFVDMQAFPGAATLNPLAYNVGFI